MGLNLGNVHSRNIHILTLREDLWWLTLSMILGKYCTICKLIVLEMELRDLLWKIAVKAKFSILKNIEAHT